MSRRRKPYKNGQSKEPPTVNQPVTQPATQPVNPPINQPAGNVSPTKSPRKWYKADLHLHTPASNDYEEPQAAYIELMRTVVAKGLDVIAITDHNTVAGVGAIQREIEWLTRLERENRLTDVERNLLQEWRNFGEKVLILPGFEFTATFGFHILGIFPPETPLRQLEHVLLSLKVPADKLDAGSTETGASTDVLTAYRIIREAGGVAIAAHANSTHGVAMRNFPFGGQTKIAYTQDPNLDALEVTDWESRSHSTARFFNGTKVEYPRRMHCVQGSDAHRLATDPKNSKRLGIGERATELLLDAPTFENIKGLFRSTQFDRTRPARPQDKPFDPLLAAREEGPTIMQSFYETASQRGGKLTTIMTDICAFANTAGGSVFVGASHRKDKPKGLPDPKEVENEIRTALEERLTPPLEVKFDTFQSQDVNILRIRVPKGNDRPYCLDENKFYLRDEAETTLAVRDEIVALIRDVLNESRKQEGKRRTPDNPPSESRPKGEHRGTQRGRERPQEQGGSPSLDATTSGDSVAAPMSEAKDAFYLPQVGVEVVSTEVRHGNRFHTIRDLRNGHMINNITRKSARKLWNYAIQQHENKTTQLDKVEWHGNIGLVRSEKRAGKTRYDLALREGEQVRVFYGVTEEGMEGAWGVFVVDDELDSEVQPMDDDLNSEELG